MKKNFLEKNIYLFRRKGKWGGIDKEHTYSLVSKLTRTYYTYTFLLLVVLSYKEFDLISSDVLKIMFVIQIFLFIITAFSYGNLFKLKKVKKNPLKGILIIVVLLLFIVLSIIETPKIYMEADHLFISSQLTLLFSIIFAGAQEVLLRSIKPSKLDK
ncbi:MAG: putative membrane protein [Candidatus Paceibacteria bacterium]|jgi:uncharacterized membrane protein